jgi:hypothetical protein
LRFDNFSEDDRKALQYGNAMDSLWFVWLIVLGSIDESSFFLGNKGEFRVLRLILTFASFIMVIHLLNMLVAIMGNTFAERSENKIQIILKDQL